MSQQRDPTETTVEDTYYEDGTPLVTQSIIARLEPIWTINIALSEQEAEWVLACVELFRAEHPSQHARRMAGLIQSAILLTRARREPGP